MTAKLPLSVLQLAFALAALCTLASAADPVIGQGGFKSGFVKTSDSVRLHYLELGKGPAVLFVPGWTGAAEFWAPQMRLLSGSWHVVALDPRSQGDSEKTENGNYTERRARDIHEVIEKLGLAPVVLIAWSRGVPESMEMIQEFGTADLRAFVSVDGTLLREANNGVRAFHEATRAMLMDRQKYVSQQVPGMFKRNHSQALYDQIGAVNLKTPTTVAITLEADLLDCDSRPALKRIDKPALFVNRAGPGAEAIAVAVKKDLPSARLEVMQDVGHAIFLDDTERFNQILIDFVKALPAKSVK